MTTLADNKVLDCVNISVTASYTVSAADAAQGNLTIQPGGSFQRTISGVAALSA